MGDGIYDIYGDMAMIQRLSPEIGKIVEKRHEMIVAHEKFGVKIKDIIEEYGISVGAYYHWSNRYARDGILGLINKKVLVIVQVRRPYNILFLRAAQIWR